MSRTINKVTFRRLEPVGLVPIMRPYQPPTVDPPRAGSMRAAYLPSRVGSQRVFPRIAGGGSVPA